MKNTLRIVTLMTVLYANSAFAATGAQGGSEFGLIGWLFIGFLALIACLQIVPALMLIGSMVAGILGAVNNQKEANNN